MTADSILTLSLPIALGTIVFGLGLSLIPADFLHVVRYPRPMLVGPVYQIILLPMTCFLIIQGFALEAALAVGMMSPVASSGGTIANLYSHLTHDDVALNITLTAVNSVIAILTMPLIVNLSLQYFMGDGQAIPLQFGEVMQVFVIVLGPVAIGMLVRNRLPAMADRLQKPVEIPSALLLLVIILLALAESWQTFVTYAPVVGLIVLVFNLPSLVVGYQVLCLLRLPETQAMTIDMEIDVHNDALVIALTLSPSLLNNSTMVIPPVIYGMLMFFTATAFGWWVSRGHQAAPAPVTVPD